MNIVKYDFHFISFHNKEMRITIICLIEILCIIVKYKKKMFLSFIYQSSHMWNNCYIDYLNIPTYTLVLQ